MIKAVDITPAYEAYLAYYEGKTKDVRALSALLPVIKVMVSRRYRNRMELFEDIVQESATEILGTLQRKRHEPKSAANFNAWCYQAVIFTGLDVIKWYDKPEVTEDAAALLHEMHGRVVGHETWEWSRHHQQIRARARRLFARSIRFTGPARATVWRLLNTDVATLTPADWKAMLVPEAEAKWLAGYAQVLWKGILYQLRHGEARHPG